MHVDIDTYKAASQPSVIVVGEKATVALTANRTVKSRGNSAFPGVNILQEDQLNVEPLVENRWMQTLHLNWIVGIIQRWQALLTEISRRDVVQVNFDLERSSALMALVVLGIAGYFGKRAVVAISSVRKDSLHGYKGVLLHRVIKIANTVVVSSDDAFRWARVINPNVKVIRRAVSSRRMTAHRADRVQPRVAVASPMDTRLLGSVLRGISFAKRKYPRAELVILGNRNQIGEIRSLMAASDRNGVELTLCENEFQMAQLLATCDVYLETSLNIEPSPAQIEALAQRMPIVIADSCGTVGDYRHGVNGLVVPAGDHVALANRLCELVESPSLVTVLADSSRPLAALHDDTAIVAEWSKLYALLHRIGPLPTKRAARLQPQYQPFVKA